MTTICAISFTKRLLQCRRSMNTNNINSSTPRVNRRPLKKPASCAQKPLAESVVASKTQVLFVINWNNTQITQSTTLAKSAPQPKRFVKRTNSAKFRKTARPPKKRYRSTSLCLLYQGFQIRSPGRLIMRSKMSSRVFSIIISQIQYQTAKPQVISLCRARDRQCESKRCFPIHIKSCQRQKYGTSQRTGFLRSGIFCNIFVVNKLQRKSGHNCSGQRFL